MSNNNKQLSDDVFFEKYTCVENPYTEGGSRIDILNDYELVEVEVIVKTK